MGRLPSYVLCVTCGLTRKQHDPANRLVLPEARHDWETPQTRAARLKRDTTQAQLPLPTERPLP